MFVHLPEFYDKNSLWRGGQIDRRNELIADCSLFIHYIMCDNQEFTNYIQIQIKRINLKYEALNTGNINYIHETVVIVKIKYIT